jgi:hypothetical protein
MVYFFAESCPDTIKKEGIRKEHKSSKRSGFITFGFNEGIIF